MLARREHSRVELQHKLQGKGHPAALVEDVVTALVREGLLSDKRFTEAYVHSRMRRGFGPVKIRAELRERGVESELIEQYLHMSSMEWNNLINEVRGKRYGGRVPEDFKERARQARFLQARGFTSDQIRRVLSEFDVIESE